jgi:hypothetical protein
MFRWEKQKDGNFWAYSGQFVIGMAVKMTVRHDSGATHVWEVSAVTGRSWLKTRGKVKSMASAKRAVKRCWADWCEVHGLTEKGGRSGRGRTYNIRFWRPALVQLSFTPREIEMTTDSPRITNVYKFQNGMVMVFDQFGKQMPAYQGPAEDVLPKIIAVFDGPIEDRVWQQR